MNHYGELAREYWRQHRPQAFSTLENPTEYFSDLGEQVQAAVTELRDRLLGPPPPNESILHYARRGRQALATAEEVILADLVWLNPEPEPAGEDEDDPMLDTYYRAFREMAGATAQADRRWFEDEETALP